MNTSNSNRDYPAELISALGDLERSSTRVANAAQRWRALLADDPSAASPDAPGADTVGATDIAAQPDRAAEAGAAVGGKAFGGEAFGGEAFGGEAGSANAGATDSGAITPGATPPAPEPAAGLTPPVSAPMPASAPGAVPGSGPVSDKPAPMPGSDHRRGGGLAASYYRALAGGSAGPEANRHAGVPSGPAGPSGPGGSDGPGGPGVPGGPGFPGANLPGGPAQNPAGNPEFAAAPGPKSPPWWTNEKTIIKIIAIIGGLITAAGIAFLVALAIQAGLLGPRMRVALTYALAASLGGVAVWAHRRKAPLITVSSLMVTGLTTANLTTTALVEPLGWVSAWFAILGILAATSVALVGARWAESSATTAWSITLGLGFILIQLPMVYENTAQTVSVATASALLLMAVAIATTWGSRIRPYVGSFLFAGNLAAGLFTLAYSQYYYSWLLTVYMLTFVGLQIVLAYISIQLRENWPPAPLGVAGEPGADGVAGRAGSGAAPEAPDAPGAPGAPGAPTPYDPANPPVLAVFIAISTSLLLALIQPNALISLYAAVLALLFAAYCYRALDDELPGIAFSAGATATLPFLALAVFASTGIATWAALPIVLVAAAVMWGLSAAAKSRAHTANPLPDDHSATPSPSAVELLASKKPNLIAGVWLAAANFANFYLLDEAVLEGRIANQPISIAEAVTMAVLLLADIGFCVAAARKVIHKEMAILGLALAGFPFLHLEMVIGLPFSVSHMLLSIIWVVLAAILALSPRFAHIDSRLSAGLSIAGLAVVKLIFFDMSALSGFVRAIAFIVSGLILLVIAIFGAKQSKVDKADKAGKAGKAGKSEYEAAAEYQQEGYQQEGNSTPNPPGR